MEKAASARIASQQEDRTGRVQQLIRDKRTAEALAATSAAQAAALRGRSQSGGRPQDYRAPEDYTRAVAEQAVREVGAEILARQASEAQEIAARAAQDAWAESTADFREKVPDFDAVVHNPNLTVTPVMADAIRESGRGAEIAYYLGKNPAEAARIASLPPFARRPRLLALKREWVALRKPPSAARPSPSAPSRAVRAAPASGSKT